MFKHILVPLDGSRLAESAIPAAASLSSTFAASVTLFHVIEQRAPELVHHDRHLTKAEQAEGYLSSLARERFADASKVDWHVHTSEVKDVAASIASHAQELGSDLIVMCAHGQGGVRDALFGSIAQQVIARCYPGVVTSSDEFLSVSICRILPLDSASRHDDAFPCAVALARAYDAEIAMLTVIPTFGTLSGDQALASSLLPGTTSALLDIEEETTQEHLAGHVQALRAEGLAASAAIARGDPAAEIVSAGKRWKADLMLLATHRRAGMDAFWARSVAPNIARRTRCRCFCCH
jgi:nucleotide-binding universal stress UspA family protein